MGVGNRILSPEPAGKRLLTMIRDSISVASNVGTEHIIIVARDGL